MPATADRTIAVLIQALAVARGMLYSARSGDATKGAIERILDGTCEASLIGLIGRDAYLNAVMLKRSAAERG